jgi:polysaccharide deacetylase family protein (PEP-CTERM system associated)
LRRRSELILTVDWEDWFHICDVEPFSVVEAWDSFGWRIEANTHAVLSLLRKAGAQATFFILGKLAERFPHLVQAIVEEGHELAWHGQTHRTWARLPGEQLEGEWMKGLFAFERAFGLKIQGFRAPMWSLTPDLLARHAPELRSHRLIYDSSLVPLAVVGNVNYPRTPTRLADLWELPPSIVSFFGVAAPISMSWGFRFLPWWYVKAMAARCCEKRQYLMLAIHPWELDPDQPMLPLGTGLKFSHYAGLKNTAARLDWFLQRHEVISCARWLERHGGVPPSGEMRFGTPFALRSTHP